MRRRRESLLRNLSDVGGEQIAVSAHRFDESRLARVVAQLAPKPRELHVDRAIDRGRGVAARPVEKLVACKDSPRTANEGDQEREFPAGENDRRSIRTSDGAIVDIDSPSGEAIDFAIRARLDRRLPRRLLTSSQDRADARREFARIEGFGELVVGADFKSDDAVDVFAARRENNDWWALACREAPTD